MYSSFPHSDLIKKKEILQILATFDGFPSATMGDFLATMGHFPATMASDYDAKMLATFANMPATFQRLWEIPRKICKFPKKWEENRFFEGKKRGKNRKMGIFSIFQGKTGPDAADSRGVRIPIQGRP